MRSPNANSATDAVLTAASMVAMLVVGSFLIRFAAALYAALAPLR